MLCCKCQEREVVIKKKSLCMLCYNRERRLEKSGKDVSEVVWSVPTERKYRHGRELEFIKNFFDHKSWVHHPGIFRLHEEYEATCTYEPDFYDAQRNVFIEVAGTRQAYHANKEKYALMRKRFPLIMLEVRDVSGNLIPEDGSRIGW